MASTSITTPSPWVPSKKTEVGSTLVEIRRVYADVNQMFGDLVKVTPDGRRLVFFELNGQPREVLVLDRSLASQVQAHPRAKAGNPLHIGAPMPGLVTQVTVAGGEQVAAGQ